MTKRLLLSGALVFALPLTAYAHLETDSLSQEGAPNLGQKRLSAEIIVDFTNFSYAVDKKTGWTVKQKSIYNKLVNDGWKLDVFNGTTGKARNQIESASGLLAFKDDQVVIATRGTEMTNWNDWFTNVRFSRSPITRFFGTEENNLCAITAQFFGGVDGEVANGFLQTHLSSWNYIKDAIIKYARSIGKSAQELQYTITGHSKGAAKAQLNAVNLLTDSTLGIGVDYLEKSFILADADAMELGASGFYGIGKKTLAKNKGNVEAVVFESPRVFSNVTAKQVNNIMGEGNLVRVENKGMFDDPVIHVAPAFLGFEHAGAAAEIEGDGFFITKHMMSNVKDAAIPAIKAHRASVTQRETVDTSAGTTKPFINNANSTLSRIKSAAKKAWGSLWNKF